MAHTKYFVSFVCFLLTSGVADGFAWNSKLDYPNPVSEVGESEDGELSDMLASQDQAIKTNSNDSIESSRLDSSNHTGIHYHYDYINVAPSEVKDQALIDGYQISQ